MMAPQSHLSVAFSTIGGWCKWQRTRIRGKHHRETSWRMKAVSLSVHTATSQPAPHRLASCNHQW